MTEVVVYFTKRERISGLLDLFLDRKFRHCGVMIRNDDGIVTQFDPRRSGSVLRSWRSTDEKWKLAKQAMALGGFKPVTVQVKSPVRPARFVLCTCVEEVKRVIGEHGFFIWTPKQLFRRITNN